MRRQGDSGTCTKLAISVFLAIAFVVFYKFFNRIILETQVRFVRFDKPSCRMVSNMLRVPLGRKAPMCRGDAYIVGRLPRRMLSFVLYVEQHGRPRQILRISPIQLHLPVQLHGTNGREQHGNRIPQPLGPPPSGTQGIGNDPSHLADVQAEAGPRVHQVLRTMLTLANQARVEKVLGRKESDRKVPKAMRDYLLEKALLQQCPSGAIQFRSRPRL